MYVSLIFDRPPHLNVHMQQHQQQQHPECTSIGAYVYWGAFVPAGATTTARANHWVVAPLAFRESFVCPYVVVVGQQQRPRGRGEQK